MAAFVLQRCESKPDRRPHNMMQGTGVSGASFWSPASVYSRPEGEYAAVASQSLQVVRCKSIIHGQYRTSRYAGGLVFQLLPTGGCHPVSWTLPRLGSTLRFDLRMQGHVSLLHNLLKMGALNCESAPGHLSKLRAVRFIKLNCDRQLRVMSYFQPRHLGHCVRGRSWLGEHSLRAVHGLSETKLSWPLISREAGWRPRLPALFFVNHWLSGLRLRVSS
jgi:hypothetical protein